MTQYTRNSNYDNAVLSSLSDNHFCIIPSHIYRALQISPTVTSNLLDFTVIKDVLSLNDILMWKKLHDSFNVSANTLSTKSFIDLLSCSINPQDTDTLEYLNSLGKYDATLNDLYSISSQTVGASPEAVFKKHMNAVFIVVERGFQDLVNSNKNVRDEFIKKYIQQAYSVMSDTEVHSTPVFKMYINSFPALAD